MSVKCEGSPQTLLFIAALAGVIGVSMLAGASGLAKSYAKELFTRTRGRNAVAWLILAGAAVSSVAHLVGRPLLRVELTFGLWVSGVAVLVFTSEAFQKNLDSSQTLIEQLVAASYLVGGAVAIIFAILMARTALHCL